jgi:predicted secreted protein
MTGHTTRSSRFSWTLVLVVAAVHLGCTLEPAGPVKERVFTAADRGAQVNLAKDELLTIELDARPSTGLTWELLDVDTSVLALAGREHQSALALGGVDRERLHFTGVAAGTTSVTLVYHRPWEEPTGDEPTYTVELQVSGPYAGAWRPPLTKAIAQQDLGDSLMPAALSLCDPGDGGYSRCTPIKNQGNCGGCWAFATAGVFENLLYFANPSVVPSLSEQYLISCNSKGYNCAEGGNVAFDYYTKSYVSPPESGAGAVYTADFPFKANDVACGNTAHPHHEKVTSWASISGNPASVATLKQAIMTAGPVWTAVCADDAFSAYTYRGNSSNDVFHGTCTDLNHAVILVGWNDNGGDGYWLMRNSWGKQWGDHGYMRIAYGANGIGSDSAKAVYGTQPPINSPPTASAGQAQTVRSGATVNLDGSGSRDTDGTIASYAWAQTGTPAVTLTGATSAKATFVAPQVTSATTLTFTLTVKDNGGATGSASVVITVKPENRLPVANAGPAQTVVQGATVTLDGSGSSDPDGTIASYAWAQSAGPTAAVSGATSAKPSFVAAALGTFTFTLTVTDDAGGTASQTVTITVMPPNQPPVADAGVDQTIAPGDTVTLDGSGSADPDGRIAGYAWVQTSGTPVTLSGATTAQPTFVTPPLTGSGTLSLSFALTVTDDRGATASASVTVTVAHVNRLPRVNAGAAQRVKHGATVRLDGSSSSDPDGTIASYAWTQTAGATVALSGGTAARPTFVAPTEDGDVTLKLTVTDNEGGTASASVVVTVVPAGAMTTSGPADGAVVGSCASVGPSDLGLALLPLMMMAWRRRR